MSNVVKWLTSDMQGAPQITNDWGVLVGMLDACLINGFNTQNPTSVTRSGSTVTMTFSGGGHGFVQHQVILVSGADQVEYNGEQRLTAVTGTTVTFTIAGAPTSPATGTIAVKTAPLGFEKPFSGTDKAVYRSPNLDSTRMFLRVDNSLAAGWNASWAKFGKVTIADAMSDVDTFTGSQAPFNPADPNRNHVLTGSGASAFNGWAKWYYAKSTYSADQFAPANGSRKWVLIGDDKGFYLSVAWQPTPVEDRALYAFGDFVPLNDGEVYHCLLQSRLSYHNAGNSIDALTFENASLFSVGKSNAVCLKSASGVGSSVYLGGICLSASNGFSTATSSGDNWASAVLPTPNSADNSNLFMPTYLVQTSSANSTNPAALRGILRGAYWSLNRKPYNDGEIVMIGGKAHMALNYYVIDAARTGLVLFDITGAW